VLKLLKPLAVVGAGGFGREVAWLIGDINEKTYELNFNARCALKTEARDHQMRSAATRVFE